MEPVFGMDVHRDLIVATVKFEEGKEVRRFGVAAEDLNGCMEWLRENGCVKGVMESAGVYWVPIYTALVDAGFNVILANAHQVKAVPGRKTDVSDSEWLAHLLRAELIKPSYVPEKRLMELRSLTRFRVGLSNTQTSFKNRVHKILQLCNIRLASKLSDIFSKSGLIILDALMKGGDVYEVVEKHAPKRIRAKKVEIKASIMGVLNQSDLFELKICLENVKRLEAQIKTVDAKIAGLVNKEDVERLSKVPGVAKVSASIILAEIGDPNRFQDEKHLASWAYHEAWRPLAYEDPRPMRHCSRQG